MANAVLAGTSVTTVPLGVAAVVVVVDQATKLAVRTALGAEQPERAIGLVGSFVTIDYAENRGAAFGLFRGGGMALAMLAVAILVGLAVYYRRQRSPSFPLALAIGLIGGGAVGNLLDRVRLGYVVDFIAIGRWPTFNLADTAITVGVSALAWVVRHGDPSLHQGGSPAGAEPSEPPPMPLIDGR